MYAFVHMYLYIHTQVCVDVNIYIYIYVYLRTRVYATHTSSVSYEGRQSGFWFSTASNAAMASLGFIASARNFTQKLHVIRPTLGPNVCK